MTLIYGGLNPAMEKMKTAGEKFAVVIVDEQSEGHFKETRDQQDVIAVAQSLGAPIYFVELNPAPAKSANKPTRASLSNGLLTDPIVVTKSTLNAFASSNLHTLLAEKGITAIVIMGFRTNCCVKKTVLGGSEKPANVPAPIHPGALDCGYKVLSCAAILRDVGPADWSTTPGVSFYTRIS